jgi:translation initiation factor IF-3
MAHLDLGRELLNQIKALLAEVGLPEEDIKQEGKRFVLIFAPKS